MNKKLLKQYTLFITVIVLDLLILIFNKNLGFKVFLNTAVNFKQMLGVLPPIFLLLGLLDVWVPKETIMKFLGEDSGILGIVLSILLGACAAGPLYGAFPVAGMMMKKGTKFSNILIFIGSWSTLKIPMFLFEISALGYKFAVTRWIVGVVGIIFIAALIDRRVLPEEKEEIYKKHEMILNDEKQRR